MHEHRRSERDQDEREPHRARAGRRGSAGRGRPHRVRSRQGAGLGSGFPDEAYTAVGRQDRARRRRRCGSDTEMIMKVKEPIELEWPHMRKGQLIFTYFHFAADEEADRAHMDSGAMCIAYETVELPIARAAAADADVRGGRPHGGAGGREVPREAVRRPRRAARRRAGRGAGEGRDPRRRHRRHQRGEDGGRAGRQGRRSSTSRSSGCATSPT